MSEILFTPAAVLDLLTQIEELNQYNIGVAETLDGKIQVTVGDSNYIISDNNVEDIAVDDSLVDQIDDTNLAAYEELSNSGEVDLNMEPVQSGVIKEFAKTLLVGGLVRLTGKLLR